MRRKYLRSMAAAAVIILTIAVFIYYLRKHPEIIAQLRSLPLSTLALLGGLYVLFFAALIWIQRATLALCDIRLGRRESSLLVIYSSIINFFGPLQSGPAFRAAYLKKRHNISLKKYTAATLAYYGFYALFSAVLLLAYLVGLWAVILAVLLAAEVPVILRRVSLPARFRGLSIRSVGQLAWASLAQVLVLAVIFRTELNSFSKATGWTASLIYTGAANFALFVSITPGAIGFRESFTLFTERLHHISEPVIITASLIDRAVYIGFLVVLAIVVFGLHAQKKLQD